MPDESLALMIRPARAEEIPALNALIVESARELSRGFYSERETAAAIRYVFGVDSALVHDGSYFVAELGGVVAGCGGWSRRRTLYGGDQRPVGGATFLDPATEPAKVRAFFVSPAYARRGVGSALLDACADAAWHAGFRSLELMATLPGVPLYAARGFAPVEDVVDELPDGTPLPFVRMRRPLPDPPRGRWRRAATGDAEAIAALHIRSWQTAYRQQLPAAYLDALDAMERAAHWRTLIATPGVVVLVREVVGTGLVAFCAAGPSRDADAAPTDWEIYNLHAAPEARGLGYGGELFDAAVALAREAGCIALTLWVVEENAPARAFYARRGMHVDGGRQVHVLAPGAELHELRYRMTLPVTGA
jgi:GNAT superfamily N-acetyltransferase